jgi:adenosylcobinamide-phosphate synthase
MLEVGVLLAALVVDLLFGEPPEAVHPVVWIGRLIGWLERVPVAGSGRQFAYGVAMVAFALGVCVVPTWLGLAWLREEAPAAYLVLGAFLLKSTFSLRGLFRAAEAVRRPLAASDLPQARRELRSLVSRDVTNLGEPLIAAAAVESVAENASDSLVAPLLYFVLFGVPGALAYRVANTFDSMVGYHGKYEYLGKAAARLDDLANVLPARLTALLLVAAAALTGGGAGRAWYTIWRYRSVTESPNAGWPMSAMAGALGVSLEKVGHYRLGDGPALPNAESIQQSGRLAGVALALAATSSLLLLVVRSVYFT